MSKKDDMPDDFPMDDIGINNDKIIQIVDKVLDNLHNRVFDESQPLSLEENSQTISTIYNIWGLVRDMLMLDDNLAAMYNSMPDHLYDEGEDGDLDDLDDEFDDDLGDLEDPDD